MSIVIQAIKLEIHSDHDAAYLISKNRCKADDRVKGAPLERLELSLSAPEADALSTELQGRTKKILPHSSTDILWYAKGIEIAENLIKNLVDPPQLSLISFFI